MQQRWLLPAAAQRGFPMKSAHDFVTEYAERMIREGKGGVDPTAQDFIDLVEARDAEWLTQQEAASGEAGTTGCETCHQCSQCGEPFSARACGPTHALIANEQKRAAAAPSREGGSES